MVFAINPADKFDAFKASAMGVTDDSSSPATPTSIAVAQTTISSSTLAATTTSVQAMVTTVFHTTATFTFPSATMTTIRTTSASATPTSVGTTYWVIVGGSGGQLTFSPSNISANVGDVVTFEMRQKNHTVTASSFAQPCTPLSQTNPSADEIFDSGFMPVGNVVNEFPTFSIRVNSTDPIWAFCGQVSLRGLILRMTSDELEHRSDTVHKGWCFLSTRRRALTRASRPSKATLSNSKIPARLTPRTPRRQPSVPAAGS
jgi:plastocyanin